MTTRTATSTLATCLPLVLLALAGCVLTPAGIQFLELRFALSRTLAAGEEALVHQQVFPAKVVLKKHHVRVSGRVAGAGGLPERLDLLVTSEDADGKVYNRFKLKLDIESDGGFSATGRWKKNIDAATLQSVFVTPIGADLPEDLAVQLCIHTSKQKATLAQAADCSQGVFDLVAANGFDDPGFHELITISGEFPQGLGATAGRQLVVALRDAGRPDLICEIHHPSSGCATVDWDDFGGRRNTPPGGGYFANRVLLATEDGPLELFLNMDLGLGRELDDDFGLG